jgi:hypothetical protein
MWREDAGQDSEYDARPSYAGQERRKSPRMRTPFAVKVRSSDSAESQFEEDTVLDNLSSQGLYVRLARRVQRGIKLLILLRCAVAPDGASMVALIELHGIVLRTEALSGGFFGTAIRLTHHRFIYSAIPLNHSCAACS